jgi:hypothetical protein
MTSVLVLTGVSQPEDIARSLGKPDFILPGVADLHALLLRRFPTLANAEAGAAAGPAQGAVGGTTNYETGERDG